MVQDWRPSSWPGLLDIGPAGQLAIQPYTGSQLLLLLAKTLRMGLWGVGEGALGPTGC